MDRDAAAGTLTVDTASRLAFSIATPADDAEIRALLRASITPGSVCVAFTREPAYALGEQLGGAVDHTIIARHEGTLVALGRSSTRTLHRNGAPRRMGYLSELRVLPGVSLGAKVLREGYAYLRDVLRHDDAEGWFTSIAHDNTRARTVLEMGGKLGVPAYTHVADLETLLVSAKGADPRRDATVLSLTPVDREELSAFLQAHAPGGQLTLTWDDDRWAALARHGITPQHFHVLRAGGRIAAAAAIWDQRAFRQVVVDGYAGSLQHSRIFINILQHAMGRPPIPTPGHPLRQASVLGATVADAAMWAPLWTQLRTVAAAAGLQWLLLARDARDPALPSLKGMLGPRLYQTRLYDVAWADGPRFTDTWDGRCFSPEVGLL